MCWWAIVCIVFLLCMSQVYSGSGLVVLYHYIVGTIMYVGMWAEMWADLDPCTSGYESTHFDRQSNSMTP